MNTQILTAARPWHPCQDFAGLLPATRGLIAAPWTPASLSLLPGDNRSAKVGARISADRGTRCAPCLMNKVF